MFALKYFKFLCGPDPGSGNLFDPGSGIHNGKNSVPGSGINIRIRNTVFYRFFMSPCIVSITNPESEKYENKNFDIFNSSAFSVLILEVNDKKNRV